VCVCVLCFLAQIAQLQNFMQVFEWEPYLQRDRHESRPRFRDIQWADALWTALSALPKLITVAVGGPAADHFGLLPQLTHIR